MRIEHLTPGDYRRLGRGLEIAWGVAPTLFGEALFAATERGLCHMSFVDGRHDPLSTLRREWKHATLRESARAIAPYTREVARRMSGLTPRSRLGLLLKGTPFRVKVWRALLELPEGRLISYAQLAAAIDEPRAVRAVASGVAENPIAYLIPCHRVIRSSGAIGEYQWGSARKAAMLTLEQARSGGGDRAALRAVGA
jgi:AraC family transcriptional regulator of adaptative response/methylated-DNA-[protein]-cysteine methyltransferase